MTDSSHNRRQRRTMMRRQQILEGAVQVFQDKGFHRATTKEIAQAADVSEGTIYNYFESKDDLLLGIISQMADLEMREEYLDEMLNLDLRTTIRMFFVQHMAQIADRYDMALAVLPEILSNPALRERYRDEVVMPGIEVFERHIQKRVDHGELQSIDTTMLVRSFVGVILGFQTLLILGDPVLKALWDEPEKLVDHITHIYFDKIMDE